MKKQNGITLIALVITIIVLLILAAVSINAITGDDSVVQQVAKSKDEFKIAEEEENIALAYNNYKLNNLGESLNAEDLQTELSKTYGEKVSVTQQGEKVKISFADSGNSYVFDGQNIEKKDNTPIQIEIGQAVKYDVTYTDAIKTTYTYNENNGWRLLSYKANAENPDLYDIEIISTGVPAGINYHYNIKSNPTIAGGWCATDEQISNYIEKFYSSASATDNNMYCVAGLYYNFEKIVFKKVAQWSSTKHYGFYNVINGQSTGDLTGEIFKSTNESIKNKITGVRNITLSDMTGKTDETTTVTDIDGLFILGNFKTSEFATKHGLTTYNYNVSPAYWIASPYSTNTQRVYYMVAGGVSSSTGDPAGLRPIVSIEGVSIDVVDDIIQIN